MAKLTMAQRRALPKSAFAVPSRAPGPGSYPMPDKAHAAIAKGLAAMHHAGSSVQKTVNAKANKKLGKGSKQNHMGMRHMGHPPGR
jgi:hypothetical protein